VSLARPQARIRAPTATSQIVAGIVPEAVVHHLEAVEVEQENGE